MVKRIQIYYSGRVQGVGFRFTVERIALDMRDIVGWVKNLPDGRVEVVAEAEEDDLKVFLGNIRNGIMKSYIKREDIIWAIPEGGLDDFIIKFY
ncbi:MAG: acylphosphatase [Candidatus Kaelpia aquatica]|nr:acylphosphatase [Candidatus Kaelpia aquatica]